MHDILSSLDSLAVPISVTAETTTLGQEILDTVFRHLNLLETSYFGLRYLDGSNQTHWLDPTKRVVKQLKGKLNKEEGGY
ncbi:hypothetical protein M8J75_015485 [Diaphorina citri]|nr:hypothetical protein M8J75_015485 [Diaphorina citri]